MTVTTQVSAEVLETHRVRLTGYCYRMLGSAECEDAVQETFIRALRHADRFDPTRARLSTWLHRIATNVCLDLLRGARRRALAVDLGPAATSGDLGAPLPPETFLEPMPDSRVLADPAEEVAGRESVRLAFLSALQMLPPKQRAVLILREVLAFSAQETAEIVETSVAAVNSALQRARAALAARPLAPAQVRNEDDPAQRELLDRYVDAFQRHDVAELVQLLRTDAASSMPPFAWWLSGAEQIAAVMAGSDACAGDRLVPIAVNGTTGLGQYRPDEAGVLRPFAILALELREGQVAHIITFLGTQERFAEFGLPDHPEVVR
ncbi:MAG TPA: RNA polymerase subunit sigma-70 [Candidatus Ruania gallistercoris]|uniref:RNA polymerase subunit sigma-70 n=1 Tax=Candidatus Ruania gallistercoris TaxID=2838746 RepID=A0A9D2EJC2_9MICO|nr:RNA polymerase subunit sigma-70 [Candidatus Ruania gallistercoris]